MNLSQKQLEAVLKLDGNARYKHFIKTVVDWQEIFGLYKDGWALAADGGKSIFPIWNAKEYAELCATNEWSGYSAKMFSLDELIGELLPNLKSDGFLIGVFYTPDDKGVVPEIDDFLKDLKSELKKYE